MAAAPDWDVKKFEQDLERQVKRRHLIVRSPSIDLNIPEDSSVYNQFLIIGVPPNKTRDSPAEILLAYPPVSLPGIGTSRIISMCLPTGTHRKYLRSPSSVVSGSSSKSQSEPIQDEFVFTIANGVDVTCYGSCVHINVPLKGNNKIPFYASRQTAQTTYVFCLLSQTPILSAHFTFLSHLALSTLGIAKMADFPEVVPPFFDMTNLIDNMDLDGQIAHHASINVPPDFILALKYYYSLKCNSPPFDVGDSNFIYFPPIEKNECLLWLSIDTLFSILNAEVIVKLVSAIILDSQVLVIGTSLQEVSMTVIALQQLIRPFRFCGPVIPILPNTTEFFNILMSPTPFIIGVAPCQELSSFVFLDSCIFVHLDNPNSVNSVNLSGSITINNNGGSGNSGNNNGGSSGGSSSSGSSGISIGGKKNVYSPNFNGFTFQSDIESVLKSIAKILSKEKSKISHPFSFPDVFNRLLEHRYHFSPDTAGRLLAAIHEPLHILLSDIIFSYFVTDVNQTSGDGVTIFNTELFLASVKKEDKPFFQALVESQNFQMYIEKMICQLQETRDSKSPLTSDIVQEHGMRVRKRSRTKSILKEMLSS